MVDNGNTYGERVSRLVGWGHWFAFFNIIAAMLIGTRYITESPWPETLLGQFYLAISWVGHFWLSCVCTLSVGSIPTNLFNSLSKAVSISRRMFATFGLTVLLVIRKPTKKINLHLTLWFGKCYSTKKAVR